MGTEGLAVQVQAVSVQTRLARARYWPRPKPGPLTCNSSGATGATRSRWWPRPRRALGLRVEVVSKPPGTKGFTVLPRRWVVERTFAWLGKYRRVARRDYETNPRNSEAWIKVCLSNLMLRRLAKRNI